MIGRKILPFFLQVMSALFGFAITVVPRVYTYYLREDALELLQCSLNISI